MLIFVSGYVKIINSRGEITNLPIITFQFSSGNFPVTQKTLSVSDKETDSLFKIRKHIKISQKLKLNNAITFEIL